MQSNYAKAETKPSYRNGECLTGGAPSTPAGVQGTRHRSFTQVPDEIINKQELSAQAKVVYIGLLHFARHKKTCFPKIEKIAKFCGMSRRTVERYLPELRKADLLESRRRVGTSCMFTLKVK